MRPALINGCFCGNIFVNLLLHPLTGSSWYVYICIEVANPYRTLPSVDRLLSDERLKKTCDLYGQMALVDLIRDELGDARQAIATGRPPPTLNDLVEGVERRAQTILRPTLRPVINATGVIIQTNLGRAPLSDETVSAMAAVSRGYSNLEFDLDAGERGSRYAHLENLLCRITGAEAAMAVNNNAAALLLGLSALAQGAEVVISRGQAVEIGGGFRIPDVMRQSGVHLVEVGTTNRTYLRDYEDAIGANSAAIMRVHASNFRIVGFTESPSLAEMAALAHERGLPLFDDLGSGSLIDTSQFGLAREPMVQESVQAGADLVFFSSDKLLGGPQAGIIVGRRDLIQQLRRHPLARALRLDKATIAGLSATLMHYLRGEALAKLPVWRMVSLKEEDLWRRARRWMRAVGPPASMAPGRSMVGGGSLPEESLPTWLLAIPQSEGIDITELARRFRLNEPAVIGRIERDVLLLDPRTVHPREDAALIAVVKSALSLQRS